MADGSRGGLHAGHLSSFVQLRGSIPLVSEWGLSRLETLGGDIASGTVRLVLRVGGWLSSLLQSGGGKAARFLGGWMKGSEHCPKSTCSPFRSGATATRVAISSRAPTSTCSASTPPSHSHAGTLRSSGSGARPHTKAQSRPSPFHARTLALWAAVWPVNTDTHFAPARRRRTGPHDSPPSPFPFTPAPRAHPPPPSPSPRLPPLSYGAPLVLFDLVRQTERRPRETLVGKGLAEAIASLQVAAPPYARGKGGG